MLLTAAALRALEYIENGMVVGLGSGRAAEAFLAALASRVGNGLQIQGVPHRGAPKISRGAPVFD